MGEGKRETERLKSIAGVGVVGSAAPWFFGSPGEIVQNMAVSQACRVPREVVLCINGLQT